MEDVQGPRCVSPITNELLLIKSLGIDALVNDSLVGMSESPQDSEIFKLTQRPFTALMWGAYAIGLLCSLFAYLYLRCMCDSIYKLQLPLTFEAVTAPAYNAAGQYTAPILLFAFLIGTVCCMCPYLV